MKKGMEGYTLTIVITLIVAVLGLVLFWFFAFHTEQAGENFATEIIAGLKDMIPKPLQVLF